MKKEPENFVKRMNDYGAVMTEEIECSLEEAFIYLNQEVEES